MSLLAFAPAWADRTAAQTFEKFPQLNGMAGYVLQSEIRNDYWRRVMDASPVPEAATEPVIEYRNRAGQQTDLNGMVKDIWRVPYNLP